MMIPMILAALLQASPLPVQAVVKSGSRSSRPAPATTVRKTQRPRVVVDAGHGGRDPGAPMRGTSIREKDVALQVALHLGGILKERGVDVVYTRTRDTLIALDDRGRIANEARGDLFISIHVNAANPRWKDPGAARGFETYFLAAAKTEDDKRVEEMENEAVRFEAEVEVPNGDPLSFILSDMLQNEHLRESADLADIVQRHLRSVHRGPDRGVKQAGFRVLNHAFMPAILVELGFGTNAQEAAFLTTNARQRAMAAAVADATMEFLERHRARVSGGTASSAR
jgi:N-acetylmuramoyl-L-alanine amidase